MNTGQIEVLEVNLSGFFRVAATFGSCCIKICCGIFNIELLAMCGKLCV